MNKFLKSKKKDEGAVSPVEAMPSSKSFWGRSKKVEPAPEPQFTIDTVLPSTDDFRTSLIMPNLSARFSMLRDQDPKSLIGKASDDSVLTPRRRSRMGLADHLSSGLGDIAEVESVRSSFRPPFADDSRTHSYASGATTDEDALAGGSMMSRARPGEGNVLFGGRQKIYKIPVGDSGSVAALGSNESRGMRGRALYEDDVHLSAFQKYRRAERERERRLAEEEREAQEDARKDSMNSPALSAYDEKRTTTSSTNSGPSMISTAATSVASQPITPTNAPTAPSTSVATTTTNGGGLQRSNSRRIYDSNLESHITEQQNEKLTRLNSLSRKGSGRKPLGQSKSAYSLRDRYDVGSAGSSRTASPMPGAEPASTIDSSLRNGKGPESGALGQFNFGFSPLGEEDEENPLVQAVNKEDRGKATALGQFNRPKQFSEEQFLVRQRSLHQQRANTRPRRLTNASSPSNPDSGNPSPAVSGQSSAIGSRRPSADVRPTAPSRPSLGQRSRSATVRAESPVAPRARAGTMQSDRGFSAPQSRNGHAHTPSVRSRADSSAQKPAPIQVNLAPQSLDTALEPAQIHQGGLSPIVDEAPPKISFERGTMDDVPAPLNAVPPSLQDHPALRIGSPERPSADKRRGWSPEDLAGRFNYIPSIDIDESATFDDHQAPPNANSTAPNLRLGGFIREHLRQISNVSSIYEGDDANEPPMPDHARGGSLLYSTSANPMSGLAILETLKERESFRTSTKISDLQHEEEAVYEVKTQPGAPQKLEPRTEPPPPPPGNDLDSLKASDAAQWMDELKKQHSREISSVTEYERKAFEDDLRERQRAIQANLKIKNENSSRADSPVSNSKSNVFESSFKPFGLMRRVSGRDANGRNRTPTGQNAAGTEGSHRPPVGRTLHMKMAGGDDDAAFEITGPDASARPISLVTRSSGPDSSRPSTAPDDNSTTRSSCASGRPTDEAFDAPGMHRRDFPSTFNSTHPTARPSVDAGRARAASTASRPPVPPLPVQTNLPVRASGGSQDSTPAITPQTAASTVSPIGSSRGTPPLSNASSISDLRSQAVSAHIPSPLAAPPTAPPAVAPAAPPAAPPSAPPGVPNSSSFTFPVRAPGERPGIVGAGSSRWRAPSVKKSDISNPTLISSTSTFDTVDLAVAEKRAALGRGKVAAAAAEINATSAATGETWAATKSAGQPPSVPPMGPMSTTTTRRGFFQRRSPEEMAAANSAAPGVARGVGSTAAVASSETHSPNGGMI